MKFQKQSSKIYFPLVKHIARNSNIWIQSRKNRMYTNREM